MTKRIFGTIASLALTAAGLQAQGGIGVGGGFGGGVGVGGGGGAASRAMIEQFQQAGTMVAAGGRGGSISVNTSQTVTGRPVSGTEVRKSMQKLGDGTEISTSESDVFYRDSAGRTRVENTSQGRTIIVDPIARVTITLTEANKTARRMPMLGSVEATAKLGAALAAPEMARTMAAQAATSTASGTYTFTVGEGSTTATVTTGGAIASGSAPRVVRAGSENMQHEELGAQSFNGVLATGTKNTLTIPQGQIGNNRDIHVINERWYSDDLQMLVKTVNSDPRFGDNTYEFTNISRDEPNSSLFQIPGDYTIIEASAGRGRGTVVPDVINKN